MVPKNDGQLASSFRDPCGFLFYRSGILYRQVNLVFKESHDALIRTGLYAALVNDGLLVSHEEVDVAPPRPQIAYKVLKPQLVPFISYPYEWCFSQMKDAALTTLRIQRRALDFGMTLKDASAFNLQFDEGKPVFVDTLSFDKYTEGQPWLAYRQFCQHFLAPLTLMSLKDIRLSHLLRMYIDGIPLDLASSLLPVRSRFKLPLLTHIHLHASSQRRYADKPVEMSHRKLSKMGLMGILDSLESCIRGLKWKPLGTEWADYYNDTNYSAEALHAKKNIVAGLIDRVSPANVWDLGGNIGVFSRIASARGIPTVSMDIDPAAVEINYLEAVSRNESTILPLVIDLSNPSPPIGWANQERMSLEDRGPADTVLALALLHHLCISNNVTFGMLADFLRLICRHLIIEFIPKSDSQVQRLLATREDIFDDYTEISFERDFSEHFVIGKRVAIRDSERVLYLMSAR